MNDIKILLKNKIDAEKDKTSCKFFVNLYGAFYDDGIVKVILELMDVGSLADVLKIFQLA
jgi:serine/threonine protein kinase